MVSSGPGNSGCKLSGIPYSEVNSSRYSSEMVDTASSSCIDPETNSLGTRTSIPNKVPIKLDLEKHNYNSWSSFSRIHLGSLRLKAHVETDTASTNPEWCQLDDLIKMWILGSLCDSLQEQVVTTPGNAKALWDHLKDLFHDNKDARAISLDNELRSVKIRKMTVNEYCTKIKAMAHRLKNLDCEVSEKNLVIFTVNGLDLRFATLAEIIRHREPLPAFETVRNMLLLKESSFTDSTDVSSMLESSSSSPNNSFGLLFFRHQRAGLNARTNTPRPNVSGHQNWGTAFGGSSNSQAHRVAQSRPMSYTPQGFVAPVYYTPTGPGTVAQSVALQQSQPNQSAHQPMVYMAHQPVQAIPGQNMSQPNNNGNGILGPAPVLYASQPTSLPSAFSTMTLQYPTWNMDTGATSHLNSNAHNLSTLFNTRLYPSIHVGDGNSIPVTNTGHSIIPSIHRSLHLNNVLVTPNIIKNLISVCQFTRDNNCTIEFDAFGFSVKDFLTRHILLRCDSSSISIQLPSCPPFLLLLFPLAHPLGTNVSVTPGMKCFVLFLSVT
ncbi:hypothetical protein Tco_0835582 [Tanacetum coccineum]